MASPNIVEVSESTFDQEVTKSTTPVLVDFWAQWCGPCKMIAPLLDEIATEQNGKLKVAKVDVDSNQGLAGKFRVTGIPTLLIFKGGQELERIVGALSKKDLLKKITPYLG